MRKKLIAGLIMVCMLCSVSYAEDSESSWTDYFSIAWDSFCEWVVSWFTSDEPEAVEISPDILPPHIASEWNALTNTLGDTLTLRDKQDTLPNYAFFGEDKSTNARKINELLDRVISMLTNGEAGDVRKQSNELRERIRTQRIELYELRNKRITAPEKSSMLMFWKLTKDKADKQISELEESIRHNETALKEVNLKLTNALRKIGLELDESQIEILMNSATGDDLMQNTIIFSNVKSIVAKLEELSQNDTNSIEITRRYTGMYLVLNDLLIHTQEELVKKIDETYKPRLNEIIREAETLRYDALRKSRMDTYTETQRLSFETNAESNGMTIRVANLYIALLDSQREGTMESIRSLKLNRDLAENTYRTVRSSGELRGLIHSGLSLFDAVNELKMPELKIFESDAMRIEFEKISGRLKN